ncbi:CgeB family protein [Numidum massiliense]|uniref:CgeB family protein n=1 Tax=Numidum massiliense TaxID=1522315 RepID=UPI0006D52B28|nr:glycosyltransferase [Numidum massiliense]
MRLFYVSSGKTTLSHLSPNIIGAFKQLARKERQFHFDSLMLKDGKQSLARKLVQFRPNVILVFGHDTHSPQLIHQLRAAKVPIGLWVVNDPYNLTNYEQKVRFYDFVVTQEASCVSFYEQRNKPCIHLALATNPANYYPAEVPRKYVSDICFIGNAWPGRIKFFNRLAPFLLQRHFVIVGKWWEGLAQFKKMHAHIVSRTIPPQEVLKYYNGAKIVLNIHRDANDIDKNPYNIPAHTPNNRTFDIAACRAFQLSTAREDFAQFYEIGREMVCYHHVKDLQQKIGYYLQHGNERRRIAQRAYRRTLSDHTYVARLQQLLRSLEVKVLPLSR